MHFRKIFGVFAILWILGPISISSSSAQSLIRGQIEMDTSLWTPIAYLSIIPDFTQMYTMSYATIIERVVIDMDGNYSFNPKLLLEGDHLYRIHFSKKDDPPASLIIGGREENHFFLLANRQSKVEIKSGKGLNLINDLSFSGYFPNEALQEINEISDYLDTLDYYGSIQNREFISKGVYEQLRHYADTCSHPLVSLYALYHSDYESDYKVDPGFYKGYNKRWRKEDSEYFEVFRSQLSWKSLGTGVISIVLIIFVILLPIGIFLYRSKTKTHTKSIRSLTVQERRVFSFLQQGLTNKEISDELGVSLSTVKSHVNKIYSKLKINSRKEVMDFVV